MPVGRASDPRRRRQGETPAQRRAERARRNATSGKSSGKRPGRQSSSRPRPRSSTGGAFKLSSTRRAAGLAMLFCVMALSVSVPLRTYLSQRAELSTQEQQRAELTQQVSDLEKRKEELSDPAQLEAEARARLGYVRPGETPYIVQVPTEPAPPPPPAESADDGLPWYEELWNSVTGKES
ncbi:Septum formation initiator [Saccharopolyspora kobensis]|uniref:Septum formation initiator n=1 Tax=Saccharopolyspora kobensis TaxID=146035 RepID=A0A1H6D3P2_9PSEU|nr:septum formation initiator family protein [Saccharopolyspora kobensis]SEG79694.1 Septum formation initiator [Saccharopolyspora kobensis]SFD09169.1 Septum formation initiator [Saccharopolyspora kobensis]